MRKPFCFFLAALFLLLTAATGCTQPAADTAVLPPTRIGRNGVSRTSLAKSYTFASAFDEADMVAVVEVGDWLGEETDIHETYYQASVIKQYKGDPVESITLLQDGNSEWTLKGYPLFTSGNQLFVAMKKADDSEYENAYWIMGAFTTLLDVAYMDGNCFLMDRYGTWGETIPLADNYADTADADALYSYLVEQDPVVADFEYRYPYIFAEEDIAALLETYTAQAQ